MILKNKKFGFAVLVLLLAFILGACSGTLPTELPSELELQIEDGVEKLEFSGEIQEMGPESWTVAGVSFLIDSDTEIQPGLELGDEVKVHAQLNAEDKLTAREIEALSAKDTELPDDDEDETEFTGPVESIGADSWVIGSTTVAVNASTEIKGDPHVGDLVKVHASMVDGVLTAREIEPAQDNDIYGDDADDEFIGLVEAIDGDVWTIGGRVFTVTSETEIEGHIQIGDRVEVELDTDSSGNVFVEEIELVDDDDFEDEHDDFDDEHDEDDEQDEDDDDDDDDD